MRIVKEKNYNLKFQRILWRSGSSKACFGAGCYWGTEKFFKTDFMKIYPESKLTGQVGFMSLTKKLYDKPTYQQVCSRKTSLVEVYDMAYEAADDSDEMYRKLVWHFFSFHDPTTKNQQGNDRGPQYSSAIFYYNSQQKVIAEEVIHDLQQRIQSQYSNLYYNNQIVTSLIEASTFYPAEEEHQNYLSKNPHGYCNHFYRFDWRSLMK